MYPLNVVCQWWFNYWKRISNSSGLTDKSTIKSLKVHNGNTINKWFGWAVLKLKKKYNRLIAQGITNSTYEVKMEILEDMSVCISDIIGNTRYLQVYYPVDDAIRNRGKPALLSPEYCGNLSLLLTSTFNRIT